MRSTDDITHNGKTLTEIADAAEEVIQAGAGLAPATVNRRLAILRRVARPAFRKWKWLDRDESGRIQLLPGEEPRYVQATPDQAEKLMAAASPRTRAAILWAVGTGLRKSELQRVQPHDFANGTLAVLRKTKTGKPSTKKKVTAKKLAGTAADTKKKAKKKAKKTEAPALADGDIALTVNKADAQAVAAFLRSNAPDDDGQLRDFAAKLEMALM